MEAVRDFLPFQHSDRAAGPGMDAGVESGVDAALAVLQRASSTTAADAAFWGFQTASDFAGRVEELSRAVEYLQLVAAAAVDRTRKQASASPGAGSHGSGSTGWTTGWRDIAGSAGRGIPGAASATPGSAGLSVPIAGEGASGGRGVDGADNAAAATDDGYRNTTDFLRARLRISAGEARRRLALAEALLPRTGLGGQQLPPEREELGGAVASAEVASRAASIITAALDRVRHACDAEASARMEHALTRTAAENDPDFLVRVARSWTDALDQDGAEPSEELLRQLQGAFIRRPRHGLQHLEIFATGEQFEHL
ncbi:MAG: hypothetical protein JWM13_1788, partial [Arthrobacter sp.]|nr:hypothetical protein [Arthrobacter sp.]